MCYIIYYETKYAKNEEDFLPTSILEIWETLVVLSRFVSVTKYWKRLDYILWHLQSRKSDNDDSSVGKVLLPCPWLDLTWNVRAPTILAMVRLGSIGFLLQVGRCYMEDHRAWQERLSTHVCWSTFVSERRSSRVTWMYYLCYVIGKSATRLKRSSIIRLVYKPVVLLPPLVPHHSFMAHTPLYFFGQRCSLYHLIAVDLSRITSKSGGLAPVITQCTVPGTATFTFDDVRALLLAYPIYIY